MLGRDGANDRHVALAELVLQVRGALWVQLIRNNSRTSRDERASYLFRSGTDVDIRVTGNDASACDAARPTTTELMPPPPWPADGWHGGPSQWSKSSVRS
jgi:hypothetical protein